VPKNRKRNRKSVGGNYEELKTSRKFKTHVKLASGVGFTRFNDF
jgi:hypothetical protein